MIHFFNRIQEIEMVIGGMEAGLKEQLVAGLSGSSRAVVIASAYRKLQRPILVVTHNLFQAQNMYDDLVQLVSENDVYVYPADEVIASELATASPELKGQRIEVLNKWKEKKIVITSVAGVRKLLPPKTLWENYQLSLQCQENIDLKELIEKFVDMGYERVMRVSAPGEFSVRGGIIDIYPLTNDLPYRIEMFDTEIESIRTFTIEDQRSQENLSSVTISPATEILVTKEQLAQAIPKIEEKLTLSLKKIKDTNVKELLKENITYELEQLKNGQKIEQLYKYMSLLYTPASLLDYMPNQGMIFLDEMSRIHGVAEQLDKEEGEWYTALLEEGKMVRDVRTSHSFMSLLQSQTHPRVYFSMFMRHVPHTNPQSIVNLSCKPMQSFHGQLSLLKTEMDRWIKQKMAVVCMAPNEERMRKIHDILEDYGMDSILLHPPMVIMPGQCQIVLGDLQAGFELPMQKLAVLTEEELFKKRVKKTVRKQKLSNAERIKSYSELHAGDYVVHINHGVGRYLGIETLEVNGVHKDFLHIQYRGTDKLYVPIDQIDQVQKYIGGAEGVEPKIYKLGGTDWQKVKKKVQSSVQDIADDLLKLYAERESAKGFPFSPDGDMQKEFELSFPYEETEDQLRSIVEIKQDMEKSRPMDRLLCGDVGYGKTEVAVRAAFKAIADGKQVAILVPTTILAQQHYETIRERFQDYPINIEVLNRFRSRKQQVATLAGLQSGTVDIVIGTHRILSKDVRYKDLGLLVVDEEQRFGVTHKEKIKQMKANVDVLTLTATPIPRTLHMSMIGVRDLSVIETPPENRFPVQTYVLEHNDEFVREAIERELARNGQVFYLYNHVEGMERKAAEIAQLVPNAKVTFAHGRMSENELESSMFSFLEREYDVLVSTTIIETGVDIPNVNTLIVQDADKMGLSQLYQLRGRVGRSNRVAYSYFTYHKDKVLSEVAEKRLQAIKEFTELGSGFKIAMRDLSIRGAGNLLGAEQHGFIDSVGFDLYSQMLKDAIDQKRGVEKKSPQIEINLTIDGYIPDSYMEDSRQKIEMYKRFRSIESLEEVQVLREEMEERFGEYPDEVEYLFQLSEIKVYASKHISSIKQETSEITTFLNEEMSGRIDGRKLFHLGDPFGRAVGFGQEGKQVKMVVRTNGMKYAERLHILHTLLKGLETAQKDNIAQVL